MDLFTLENITISRDWLTPIGVALVLLSFYWLRDSLTPMLKTASVIVLVFWLASLGYLLNVCYGAGFTMDLCGSGNTSGWTLGPPSQLSSRACRGKSLP